MSGASLPAGLAIVTGIAAEAKIARRIGMPVACSGGVPERAAHQARDLIARGAKALMSFGIAGGLAPDLPPGSLAVASSVVTPGARYPADSSFAGGIEIRIGAIYGGAEIASEVSEKHALFRNTGAIAIDLESGAVAQIAAEAGIPFLALRAIADPAWRGLPPAALLALSEDGSPNLAAVFGSIMKKPGQIPGLISTAIDTRAALKALLRACRVLAV